MRWAAKEKFLPGLAELSSGGVGPGGTLLQGLTQELKEEADLHVKAMVQYIGSFCLCLQLWQADTAVNFAVDAREHQQVRLNPEARQSFR